MLNDIELKELHDEYWAIADRIHKLEMRQYEIDATLNHNACEVVASRFPHFEFGDKIRVTIKKWNFNGETTEVKEGFYGRFFLDGHQIVEIASLPKLVHLRLRQVKKDGTMSQKYDDLSSTSIVSIEKVEE